MGADSIRFERIAELEAENKALKEDKKAWQHEIIKEKAYSYTLRENLEKIKTELHSFYEDNTTFIEFTAKLKAILEEDK